MEVSNKAWICSLLVCGTLIGIHKELRKQKNEPTYNEKQIENIVEYYNTFERNDINEYELNIEEIELPEIDINDIYKSDEYIYINGEIIKKEDFSKYVEDYYSTHIEGKVKQKIR